MRKHSTRQGGRVIKNFAVPLLVSALCAPTFSIVSSAFILMYPLEAKADITTGLVSHWKFDEGTGTTAADSTGGGHTGTLTNGPTWTTGLFGSAVELDGSNDHVVLPDGSIPAAPRTVSMWIKADNVSVQQGLLHAGALSGCAPAAQVLRLFTSKFAFFTGCGSGQESSVNLVSNRWHQVTQVLTSTTDSKLYVDGVLVSNSTDTTGGLTISAPNNALLGMIWNGGFKGFPFDGAIDDVRVYDRALSDSDVQELFPDAPGGVAGGLRLWLKADAGVTGNPVTAWADQSGQGNDTTAFNAPAFVSGAINGNPAVNLDPTAGNGQFLRTNTTSIIGNNNAYTKIAVIKTEGTSEGNNIISSGGAGTHALWGISGDGDNLSMWHSGDFVTSNNTIPVGRTRLISGRYGAGANPNNILVDGTVVGSQAATVRNFTDTGATTQIGQHSNTTGVNFDGHVAEVVIYRGYVSDADLSKVASYLAVKYGITLSHNYLDSASAVIWDVAANSTYSNDIAGIGRDDASVLNQKQSTSVETTSVVTIGRGGIAADNASNANQFSTDKQFLVWGHNNGVLSAWSASGAPAGFLRLARTWHVEKTGTVGSTAVSFDVANATANIPDDIADYYLLRDSDNDNSLTDETPVLLHDDGTNGDPTAGDNKFSVSGITWGDGEEFTLATQNLDIGIDVIVVDSLTGESTTTPDTGSFKLKLHSQPAAAVTIPLSVSDPAEGTTTASIIIQPADWNNPDANVVTVAGVDDPVEDGAVQYTVITGDPTSGDANYDALGASDVADVTMFNQNDDVRAIFVDIVDNTTGEGGGTATVRVRLLSQPAGGADVTIPLSVSDGTEGSAPASITVLNANWDTPASNEITITGLDDNLNDGDVVYQLVTGDPTSGDAGYDSKTPTDVADPTLVNVDNDDPGLTIAESGGSTSVSEAGATDTFTVRLNSEPAPGKLVLVDIDPDSQLDLGSGEDTPVQLTFDDSNWDQLQTVPVEAFDDANGEGAHTGSITLSINASSTEPGYSVIGLAPITVSIDDNDASPVEEEEDEEEDDDRSSSSGTTLRGRVKNLIGINNLTEAERLIQQYPQFFNEAGAAQSAASCSPYEFTRTLRLGMEGEDVRALQRLMNCFGFVLAASGPGALGSETIYFADRTLEAVKRFQSAHAADILAPLNLSLPTGIFGEYSRQKAEELTSSE